MKLEELKMLERVRSGLDTDANLSEGEKKVTRYLYLEGYIGACPVEGSDCAQDALWITEKGLAALGKPAGGSNVSPPARRDSEEAVRGRLLAHVRELLEAGDIAVMKADLLLREAEKNAEA